MWTLLFYSFGIYFLFKEIGVFVNPKREWGLLHFRKHYETLLADAQGDPELEKIIKGVRGYSAIQTLTFHLPYSIWALIGLFSSQWIWFAALSLLRVVTTRLIKRSNVDHPNQLSIIRIDSFTSILTLIFIVFNHFQ